MFGIYFDSHPDLRRILTDYGFDHFPLRKDFPLTGTTSIMYSDLGKNLSYQKLNLYQEYRMFHISKTFN
jgi:NADH-quinone oxidoreductase subunit C